jgi:hypothetical protein
MKYNGAVQKEKDSPICFYLILYTTVILKVDCGEAAEMGQMGFNPKRL